MAITHHALRVYATIEGLKNQSGADVIDALLPFTFPIMEVLNEKVFDPELLVAGVEKLYGWRITSDIAHEFGARLEARGILVRPSEKANVLIVHADSNAHGKYDPDFDQEVSAITEEFHGFLNELGDLIHYGRNKEELLDILVQFVVQVDLGKADTGYTGRSELSAALRDLDSGSPLSHDDRYVCAKFIEYAASSKPALLTKLERLASVGLLAEVVQDFAQPTTKVDKSSTTFLLDAPLGLAILGVSGNSAKRDIELTVSAARKLGCRIEMFGISCDEITKILETTLSTDRSRRFGPTHTAIIKREVTEDYVTAVMKNPERALINIDVGIRHMDLSTTPSSHNIFSKEAYQGFFSLINWKINTFDAREHDASCMTMISRLRSKKKAVDIFDNNYLFVTANKLFSLLAKRYAIERRDINLRHASPVIHQSNLATAAWLRTGLNASTEIPVARLLAQCERVLCVNEEVIEKANSVVKSFSPEKTEQFSLLLQDSRSTVRLMDYTLGNENAVTSENIEELLQEMRRATVQEVEDEYKSKINDLNQQASSKFDAERLSKTKHAEKAAQSLSHNKSIAKNLCTQEATLGNRFAGTTKVLIAALLIGFPFLSFLFPIGWSVGIRGGFVAVMALIAAASAYLTFFANSSLRLNAKIGEFWKNRSTKKLKKLGIIPGPIGLDINESGKIGIIEVSDKN